MLWMARFGGESLEIRFGLSDSGYGLTILSR